MDHHNLDIYSNPRDESNLYINEPWIVDFYLFTDSSAQAQIKGDVI